MGEGPLTAANGFADLADMLANTRLAAGRPEGLTHIVASGVSLCKKRSGTAGGSKLSALELGLDDLSIGLIGLIDDVVGIAKIAAASLDDVTAQASRAGIKAAGLVVDDTAVTPRYVVGFAASRELPIIAKITVGSLRNKLLLLLPAALALSYFAPWVITPLLMVGGLYLCFEGAEKVLHALGWHDAQTDAHGSTKPGEEHLPTALLTPEEEARRVKGAVRTDFILSAEIMAITLSTVASSSFVTQAVVLAIVGIGITLLVYGVVAVIVKADDVGLAMANRDGLVSGPIGRTIVRLMPGFLQTLSIVGTAAMLWVGGGIILHGLEEFGFHALPDAAHHLAGLIAAQAGTFAPLVGWFFNALVSGVIGLALGAVTAAIVGRLMPSATH